MKYNPDIHNRRSIRLKGHDYSQSGAYFVTICVHDRACLFGRVEDNVFEPSDAGIMVETIWEEMPQHYKGMELGSLIVMPNHVHAIFIITTDIVGATPCGCPISESEQPTEKNTSGDNSVGANPRGCPITEQSQNIGQPQGVAPTGKTLSLSDVVHRYKTMTTKRYTDGVKNHGWTPFRGKLWQRNYYEHIIRNDEEYQRIAKYIENNPKTWKDDKLWTE